MLPFKNLKELMATLSDEQTCRDYFEQMRWKGNPVCPHCQQDKPYRLKDGRAFRCRSKTCKKDFSVTVGTVFENSKIPLSVWFPAIFIATAHKKGISSLQLHRDLGVSEKTAWFMLHRIREMVKPKTKQVLKETVELDVTWAGGKEKNKSKSKRARGYEGYRNNDKVPVFGLVQRNGDAILTVVPDERSETLKPIIAEIVGQDTVIISDGANALKGLEDEYIGHITVNHSANEYANGIYHTNTIEGFFSMLKRSIYGIYHQVSPKHLQRYCSETCYRYNTRKIRDNERFIFTLQNSEGRLKYNTLVGR